jgi:sec-independent protein translocase protein TatA
MQSFFWRDVICLDIEAMIIFTDSHKIQKKPKRAVGFHQGLNGDAELDFWRPRCNTRLTNQHRRRPSMFGFGMPELIVILVIVLVVFGAGRLPEIGAALGKSIRNFKKASDGKDEIEIKPDKKDEPPK